MPTPRLSDDDALAALQAVAEHDGSIKAAAAAADMNYHTFRDRVFKARQRGLHVDPAMRASMAAVGTRMEPTLAWVKTQEKDENGNRYSVLLKPQRVEEDRIERIRAAFENLTPVQPIEADQHTDADLLAFLPVADMHAGLQAWADEAGENYDTKLAVERLVNWSGRVIRAMPRAEKCVILFNGDTLHANDQTNTTPTNKHPLDVDTRHFRTLDLTIEGIAAAVEQARQWFGDVEVVIRPGNHDPEGSLALMFALAQRHRLEPRVTVDKKPGEFWHREFGRVLLLAHHGHRLKPEELVLNLAHQYSEGWGRTRYRYLWTGHKHRLTSADIGGVQWEQSRAMTARDAYAAGNAYPARAELQGITYHRDRGEIGRVRVAA